MPAPGMHSGVATDDALNLAMSEHAVPLYEAVKAFIANEIEPITEEFYRLGANRTEHWGWGEGQLEEEMTRHGWFTAAGSPAILFDTPADERWETAFQAEGIDPRLLASETGAA